MRKLIEIQVPKNKKNALDRLNYIDRCKDGIIRDSVIVLVKGEDIFKDDNIVDKFRQMMEMSNIPELIAETNIFNAIRDAKNPCWVWVDEYIDEISFGEYIPNDFVGSLCTSRTHQMSFLLTQHSEKTNPKIEANADVIIDIKSLENMADPNKDENLCNKLHLCCGKRDFGAGWINIDAFYDNHIDYNIKDLDCLPFPHERFDLIYCSHALTYFDRDKAKELLAEWKRVLKTGGTLRLAVPDFDRITYLYRTGQYDLDDMLGLLYGKWNIPEIGNIYFKTAYDYQSLRKLLMESGFNSVELYDFSMTEHSEFDDHSKAHLPHDPEAIRTGNYTSKHTLVSLNVECKK